MGLHIGSRSDFGLLERLQAQAGSNATARSYRECADLKKRSRDGQVKSTEAKFARSAK